VYEYGVANTLYKLLPAVVNVSNVMSNIRIVVLRAQISQSWRGVSLCAPKEGKFLAAAPGL
jgi:hypothetical protein